MIPIKIQGKKYKIKSIPELTAREFIEMCDIENIDMTKYIAWQTGVKMDDAFFAVVSNAVEKAIGKAEDIEKIKKPKGFDYSKVIDTVGQRHQIESCKYKGYKLVIYCLAVSQARSNNHEDVDKLFNEYMEMPYTKSLPAGFFFLKRLPIGKKLGRKRSRMLLYLIRKLKTRKQRASKG